MQDVDRFRRCNFEREVRSTYKTNENLHHGRFKGNVQVIRSLWSANLWQLAQNLPIWNSNVGIMFQPFPIGGKEFMLIFDCFFWKSQPVFTRMNLCLVIYDLFALLDNLIVCDHSPIGRRPRHSYRIWSTPDGGGPLGIFAPTIAFNCSTRNHWKGGGNSIFWYNIFARLYVFMLRILIQ